MRVAILWKQLSGYAGATFRALAATGVDVLLVYRSAQPDAPFDDGAVASGLRGHHWETAPDEERLRSEIEAFAPDALLVISWDVGGYRRLSRAMRGRTLRVLCMDNQWQGTAKQWAGRLASPVLIRPTYDVAFLPGEPQAAFARRLGFRDDQLLWGLYTCDHDAFAAVAGGSDQRVQAPSFVFVGRLVPEKGVDVLARAYRAYRDATESPWPLVVCGTGPFGPALDAIPGVTSLGFVQPAQLPEVFSRAACLVLPSTFEPWGVVVHEAASAGLAVICTSRCGAATRLVLDGYNGVVVTPGEADSLTTAMTRISGTAAADRAQLSARSTALAAQFTPQRWARYLVERVPQLRATCGLDP